MSHLAITLWSFVAQAAPTLPPIPVVEPNIPTWLSGVVATGGLFQVIKIVAARFGWKITGYHAMIGSFLTGIAVALMQVQIGALAILPVEIGGILPWVYGVLTEALKATVGANATYKYVYRETLKQLGLPPVPSY